MIAADAEARAYLRQRGLRRPLGRAREHFERLGRVGGAVDLGDLDADEASALSGLLAPLRRREKPRPGRPFRLRLRDMDEALRATRFGVSLKEALELVGPPLDLRPQRRERARAAAAAAWADALEHPLCHRDAPARAWAESLRANGTLTRIAGEGAMGLLAQALDLGARLPLEAPVERTRLATELSGDPHALDEGRPLSRLMLSQLAFRAGVRRPEVAIERRALWQEFRVVSDPASADVLTVGLRPLPRGPLAKALLLMEGRHFRVTIGQLAQEPLEFERGLDVFLCENTTVLTAAEARLGGDCPPLVCTEGWPSSAAWTLLETLTGAGARLRYHGDFDWDGVRIALLLRDRFGALPWRFDAESYRAGVQRHGTRTRALDGRAVGVDAGGALAAAMQELGRELHEEAVIEEALEDLGRLISVASA